ncbi:nitrogenase molybdenum-iron protein alpha chain [Holophaga foetida]|uniref:nitrogenase molybdenum-iron protein alpha chain n=1 Tax=Holophaga foetida TaxID=35839 RepID=UPI000247330F|nr:nitrogenase molybdenum-iron protein alpha chain [Holophaga foetida]
MPSKLTPEELKQELLKAYPAKVARKREKQIIINKHKDPSANGLPTTNEVLANARTIPGILSMRGCAYAGCKGVVLGPTRDILHIVHGPIGCSYYAWLTRRNQTRPVSDEDPNFMTYCFSTDMQEEDIIYGGEKKLKKAIDEAIAIFKPKALDIFSTCPVGLIGDDVHAVAREMEAKYPDVNIFGFSCEGYKGVSQSAGHHIANNKVFTDVLGLGDLKKPGKYRVNLLGEYNIGGDAFELERVFEKCGITLQATFSGNSTYEEFTSAHNVDLNLVMCHRSINYMADMMETKYGIPWFKVNFIGAESSAKSLRKIGQYYGDQELIDRIEAVIAEEMPAIEAARATHRPSLEGKTAVLFVGGSRAHHYQDLFHELGMETISAGYEFAHRDDYEGRHVLSSIKVDADSRNIEEIEVHPDAELYKERVTPERKAELLAMGIEMNGYEGMMPEMKEGALIIDDLNHHEAEVLIEKVKPAIFGAGVKEKYVIQKSGVPLKQLHSYDYSGPYAGFKGAINFYAEIDRLVNASCWGLVKAPWQSSPELSASYAYVG